MSLLPVAKQIYVDGMDEPYYTQEKEPDKKDLILPSLLCVILVFLTFFFFGLQKFQTGLMFFGLFFIFGGLSGIGKRKIGISNLIDNLKKNTIFPIAGLILFCIGAFVDLEIVNYKIEETSWFFAVFFFASLILLFLGRLTFLLIKASAISKRKNECTHLVAAVHYDYEDPNHLTDYTGFDISKVGDPIYKYQYEGTFYKFPIVTSVPARYDSSVIMDLYIDPDHPERYYDEQLFSRNDTHIRMLLKGSALFAAFTIIVGILLFIIVFYTA